jgi:hypothetical protein
VNLTACDAEPELFAANSLLHTEQTCYVVLLATSSIGTAHCNQAQQILEAQLRFTVAGAEMVVGTAVVGAVTGAHCSGSR